MDTAPVLLKAAELAELLRVTRQSVYSMNNRGEIPGAIKIGRRLRFDRGTVLDWIRRASSSSGATR